MRSGGNPFEDGKRAAARQIPAEANPYAKGTDEHGQWREGHESVANAREASESESE
jgi:hypothetical protein